jgi:hypothetical protein
MIAPFLISVAAIPALIAFWLVAWLVANLLASPRPVVARQRDRDERRR